MNQGIVTQPRNFLAMARDGGVKYGVLMNQLGHHREVAVLGNVTQVDLQSVTNDSHWMSPGRTKLILEPGNSARIVSFLQEQPGRREKNES